MATKYLRSFNLKRIVSRDVEVSAFFSNNGFRPDANIFIEKKFLSNNALVNLKKINALSTKILKVMGVYYNFLDSDLEKVRQLQNFSSSPILRKLTKSEIFIEDPDRIIHNIFNEEKIIQKFKNDLGIEPLRGSVFNEDKKSAVIKVYFDEREETFNEEKINNYLDKFKDYIKSKVKQEYIKLLNYYIQIIEKEKPIVTIDIAKDIKKEDIKVYIPNEIFKKTEKLLIYLDNAKELEETDYNKYKFIKFRVRFANRELNLKFKDELKKLNEHLNNSIHIIDTFIKESEDVLLERYLTCCTFSNILFSLNNFN